MNELLAVLWQNNVVVSAVIFVCIAVPSFIGYAAWDNKRHYLALAEEELEKTKLALAESKERDELAKSMRFQHVKEFVAPAANKVTEAIKSGQHAPKVQAYEYLGTLLPLWADDEINNSTFEEAVEMFNGRFEKGTRVYVAWSRDKKQKKLVLIFRLIQEAQPEPFEVARSFNL